MEISTVYAPTDFDILNAFYCPHCEKLNLTMVKKATFEKMYLSMIPKIWQFPKEICHFDPLRH